MFGFGQDKKAPAAPEKPSGMLDSTANTLAQHLISVGIGGVATFKSARAVADEAMKKAGSKEAAMDDVVASHTKLAGANGFLTNLGGFVTLPVALPANVIGFYTVATRMVAAIAAINGHDVDDPAVRSAILLDLIGADATQVLKGLGPMTGGVATNVATRKLPPAALAVVNKSVAFRLGSQVGRRFLTRIPRLIPVAGGFIGGGLDVGLIRKIAQSARRDVVAQIPPSA